MMGLFMKDDEHLGLFKNSGRLIDNNQTDFCSDYLSDMIKNQQTANQLIQRAIQALKNAQNRSNQRQIKDWKTLEKQLHDLKELHAKHEQLEQQVIDWLEKLEAGHQVLHTTVTNEQLEITNLINQISNIDQSQTEFDLQLKQMAGTNEEMVKRLGQYNTANNKIAKKLNQFNVINDAIVKQLNHNNALNNQIAQRLEQDENTNDEIVQQLTQIETKNDILLEKVDAQQTAQQTMVNQITNIEETQKALATRLESQEGFMEKVLRQIDHLRSILYERTNFLEGKIVKTYENTNKTYTKS